MKLINKLVVKHLSLKFGIKVAKSIAKIISKTNYIKVDQPRGVSEIFGSKVIFKNEKRQ